MGAVTGPYNILSMMMGAFPFYFVTLEQHYVGEMNLPEINGVDEGSLVIVFVCFISGIIGNEHLWKYKIHIFD